MDKKLTAMTGLLLSSSLALGVFTNLHAEVRAQEGEKANPQAQEQSRSGPSVEPANPIKPSKRQIMRSTR